jgi:DNA-directed RNA polymerase sigma subunit (sigma70/sigma32)
MALNIKTNGKQHQVDVSDDAPLLRVRNVLEMMGLRFGCSAAPCGAMVHDRVAALCRRWKDQHDIGAANELARSHRKLIFDIAHTCIPNGALSADLVAEGQLGLMRAICRFDPDSAEGFAVFAARHVRAAIRGHMNGQLS